MNAGSQDQDEDRGTAAEHATGAWALVWLIVAVFALVFAVTLGVYAAMQGWLRLPGA